MKQDDVMERMRELRRRFFAMRNGEMGMQLRRSGLEYRVIFGLTLPQIAEIARDYEPDRALARALWESRSARETQMIAPMLYPREQMDRATAIEWIEEASTVEVADVLCHRLIRHLPFAVELPAELLAEGYRDCQMARYCAVRLMANLLSADTARRFRPLVEAEVHSRNPLTLAPATMLLSDIEWLLEEDAQS